MDRSIVPMLVEALGVQKAAERVLDRQQKVLDQESEQLLLDNWTRLESRTVFWWLTRKPPEGASGRPYANIVPKLVEWLVAEAASLLGAHYLPGWIGLVADDLARDDLVEQLQGRLPEHTWERTLPHASGCEAYKLLAAFDYSTHKRKHEFPHGLVPEGPVPRLHERLFGIRREQPAVIERLRAMVADEQIGPYTLWVLREVGLLHAVATPALILDGLPTLVEADLGDHERIRFHLDLADGLAAADAFREAITHRILSASARGVPWGHLWWETPPSLRDQIGLVSIDTSNPATWASLSARRLLEGRARWERLLDWFSKPEPSLEECKHFHVGASLRSGDPFGRKKVEGRDDFWPQDHNWLLRDPLPEDADLAFEERLGAVLRRLPHCSEAGVASRLSDLPLTADRARRLVEQTLDAGFFYTLAKCVEIAFACGKLNRDVPRPATRDTKALRAYRLLASDALVVEKWFDEAITGSDFHVAFELARYDERLRTSTNVESLRRLLPRDDFRRLIRYQQDHNWLFSEADVIAALTEREFPDEQWRWLGKAVPAYLRPVIKAKAASTTDALLAASLLECLQGMGVGPTELASLAVERIVQQGLSAFDEHRVGHLLASGRLWDGPGKSLLGHVLRSFGQPGGAWLLAVAYESAEKNRNLVRHMHVVLATVLIEMAGEAIGRDDGPAAQRSLRALACLTAPPRLFKDVRALSALTTDPSIRVLLEANEGLMRRSDDEAATFDALTEALSTVVNEAPAEEQGGAA